MLYHSCSAHLKKCFDLNKGGMAFEGLCFFYEGVLCECVLAADGGRVQGGVPQRLPSSQWCQ